MTSFVSRYDESDYFDSIDYLYNLIIENENSEHIINLIFIKLVITLEVFIERLSKPFIYECKQLTVEKLPTRIKLEHSKFILDKLKNKLPVSEKHGECEQLFSELSSIWSNKDHRLELNFDLKFKSGKHGNKEIIDIFEKIGIDNILSQIKIEKKDCSFLDSEIEYYNIELFIQELVAKRNLAIHQGVNLSTDYSKENIADKIYITKCILQEINKILDSHIAYLKQQG